MTSRQTRCARSFRNIDISFTFPIRHAYPSLCMHLPHPHVRPDWTSCSHARGDQKSLKVLV
jgi:hypothetical protein